MALIDTLEALAASYNRGEITLPYAACVLQTPSIQGLLELALHFGITFIGTNPITREKLNDLEKEYDVWRKTSTTVRT